MKYDAVIILGRGIYADGSLPESVIPTISKAVEMFRFGQTSKLIFSGRWTYRLDFTPPKTEAATMAEQAIELGLPKKAIILEENSYTTVTNAYFIKKNILIPNKWHRVALVSVYPMAPRAHYVLSFVFGPEYQCDLIVADFQFPADKIGEKERSEKVKLAGAKLFYKANGLIAGDHETIFAVTKKDLKENWIKK